MFKGKSIKGVNLGGWLLMEGYILGGRNIAESCFKENFKNIYGKSGLEEFQRLFRDNFIREEDFKNIALMGANSIRVPFNCRLIESRPFVYSQEGFSYLDRVLKWSQKYKLGVILDLHAACGAQNEDWHSDSLGGALLWKKESYQERTYSLWEAVADRFKDYSALIGYDVLNEPVMPMKDKSTLKKFYREVIKRIKAIDSRHLLFLEGNRWAQKVSFLGDLVEENVCVSIHTYEPLDYTFNFTPFYKFPGKVTGTLWNPGKIYRYLKPYAEFASTYKARIYVGEFGINWRGGHWGELDWLGNILKCFEELGFGYTYWTYKAVSQNSFPDGIYQYIPNNNYIRRQGHIFGWENYLSLWKSQKNNIVDFWRTRNYTANQAIISKLKQYFSNV